MTNAGYQVSPTTQPRCSAQDETACDLTQYRMGPGLGFSFNGAMIQLNMTWTCQMSKRKLRKPCHISVVFSWRPLSLQRSEMHQRKMTPNLDCKMQETTKHMGHWYTSFISIFGAILVKFISRSLACLIALVFFECVQVLVADIPVLVGCASDGWDSKFFWQHLRTSLAQIWVWVKLSGSGDCTYSFLSDY